jgi:hypothetical protein
MTEKLYKVTGCGISAIGPKDEALMWIIERIIMKGGVPVIEFWDQEKQDQYDGGSNHGEQKRMGHPPLPGTPTLDIQE